MIKRKAMTVYPFLPKKRLQYPKEGFSGNVRVKHKATTDVFLMFIIGVIAALLVFVMINRVVVKTLHGECIKDMQKETDKVQASIARIGNPGQTLTMPVKLGSCVEALMFTNQERFSEAFKKANIKSEQVFKCPAGYKSMIAAVPVIGETGGSFLSGIWKFFKEGDITEIKNWILNAAGFSLKAYCKALSKPEHVFENDYILEGSKTTDKKYCLKVLRDNDSKFTIGPVPPQEIKSDSECETDIQNIGILT